MGWASVISSPGVVLAFEGAKLAAGGLGMQAKISLMTTGNLYILTRAGDAVESLYLGLICGSIAA
jgi:hypothetical protein